MLRRFSLKLSYILRIAARLVQSGVSPLQRLTWYPVHHAQVGVALRRRREVESPADAAEPLSGLDERAHCIIHEAAFDVAIE